MAARRLRVLLVSPKGEFFFRNPEFRKYAERSREMQIIRHTWNGTGVTLPTIAAVTPGDHDLTIVDENFEPVDFEFDCDVVGITAFTQQADHAYEIAAEFRRRGRHVAIGGIHASVVPEEVERHADTVFVGEGELTWPLFIRDYLDGCPKHRYDQADHPSVEMQSLPTPRFDLIAKYQYPVIWLQTTRGCPHDCEFCAASRIYGRRYKHKNLQQVVAEIRAVKRYWRFSKIGFADDNMFVKRSFSEQLVGALAKLEINWLAQTDIAVGEDPTFLSALRAAGCRLLLIGFESVVAENLKGLDRSGWKSRMFPKYAEHIDTIQRNGLGIYGTFILGLDRDDRETVDRTVDFVTRHRLMGAQLSILTPFPGSRLRSRLLDEGRILHSEWKWYTGWNAVISHPQFSPEDMEAEMMRFYRSVYDESTFKDRARYLHDICRQLV